MTKNAEILSARPRGLLYENGTSSCLACALRAVLEAWNERVQATLRVAWAERARRADIVGENNASECV